MQPAPRGRRAAGAGDSESHRTSGRRKSWARSDDSWGPGGTTRGFPTSPATPAPQRAEGQAAPPLRRPASPLTPRLRRRPPSALRARCRLGEVGAGQGATRGSRRPLHWMEARRCLRGGDSCGHRAPGAATPPAARRLRGGGSRRAVVAGGGRSCRPRGHRGPVARALGQVPGARCPARRPRPPAPPPGRRARPAPARGPPGAAPAAAVGEPGPGTGRRPGAEGGGGWPRARVGTEPAAAETWPAASPGAMR